MPSHLQSSDRLQMCGQLTSSSPSCPCTGWTKNPARPPPFQTSPATLMANSTNSFPQVASPLRQAEQTRASQVNAVIESVRFWLTRHAFLLNMILLSMWHQIVKGKKTLLGMQMAASQSWCCPSTNPSQAATTFWACFWVGSTKKSWVLRITCWARLMLCRSRSMLTDITAMVIYQLSALLVDTSS